MVRTLRQVLRGLPMAQRAAVKRRGAKLVAEELARRGLAAAPRKK